MQDQEYCRSKVYAQLATLCNGAHPDGHASLLKRAGDQIVEDKACGPAEGEPLHGSNHCHALKKFVGNVRGCIRRPRVEEDANYPRPAPVAGKAKSPNRHSRLMKCLGCLLCVPLDEKEEDEQTAERYAKNRYLDNHLGDYCWPEYGVCIHPRPPNRVGRSSGGLVRGDSGKNMFSFKPSTRYKYSNLLYSENQNGCLTFGLFGLV